MREGGESASLEPTFPRLWKAISRRANCQLRGGGLLNVMWWADPEYLHLHGDSGIRKKYRSTAGVAWVDRFSAGLVGDDLLLTFASRLLLRFPDVFSGCHLPVDLLQSKARSCSGLDPVLYPYPAGEVCCMFMPKAARQRQRGRSAVRK